MTLTARLAALTAASTKGYGVLEEIVQGAIDMMDLTRTQVAAATIDDDVQVIRTTGYTSKGDGGSAFYIRAGSMPSHQFRVQSADGAWWEGVPDPSGVVPEQFGGTSDATSIQAMMTWAASFSDPVRLRFREGVEYTIGSLINCDLPEGSSVCAEGARFDISYDGPAFDLNPTATAAIPITVTVDTYTKRRIYWSGGQFTTSAGTRTASVAIRAYFMRGLYVSNVYATGLYAAFEIGAKDTYHFRDCYTYDCTRHYWQRAPGVLYTASLTGNDMIDVHLSGCHMSADGNEAGVYFENRVINFRMSGGSINGGTNGTTVAHVRLADNATLHSRSIAFEGVHFEEIAAGLPGIMFVDSGQGFYNISIGDGTEFGSSKAGWKGVATAHCIGMVVDALFSDGSGGGTEIGIQLDTDSRAIVIHDGVRYGRTSARFLNVATPVSLNGASRSDVALMPETIDIPQIAVNDGSTDLTNRTASGDLVSTTIDMSAVDTAIASSALPPVAYDVSVSHADTGSSAAGAAVWAGFFRSGSTAYVRADVRGVANSEARYAVGRVPADANGDINVQIEATGASTATTTARLLAVHR